MLSVRKGWRLTGSPARDQTVALDLFDAVVDQFRKAAEVDAQILFEWRDQRDDDASEIPSDLVCHLTSSTLRRFDRTGAA